MPRNAQPLLQAVGCGVAACLARKAQAGFSRAETALTDVTLTAKTETCMAWGKKWEVRGPGAKMG